MGSKVTGISAVQLATKTAFTANGTANLHIAGSTGGGDVITLGAASQSVLSGGIDEHVIASAANAGARISGLGVGSELEITGGGAVTLNSATGGTTADPLIVQLDAATNLTLSAMQFINAVAGSGIDTITAEAKYQTLTGGTGTDSLIGYAGGYDTFKGTAAGLNGDTIKNFLATDQIDITSLNSGHRPSDSGRQRDRYGGDRRVRSKRNELHHGGFIQQVGLRDHRGRNGGIFLTHS